MLLFQAAKADPEEHWRNAPSPSSVGLGSATPAASGAPAPHKRSEELKASLVLLPRPRGTEEPQLLSLHQLGLERENKRARKPKPAAETPQEEQEPSKGSPPLKGAWGWLLLPHSLATSTVGASWVRLYEPEVQACPTALQQCPTTPESAFGMLQKAPEESPGACRDLLCS